MPEITNPRELFLHELGDILYVERKLVQETLPKLIGEVQDKEFKAGLKRHLTQTRGHVRNVEKAFKALGEKPEPEKCIGFEGLKSEHDKMLGESSASLVDLVDLGATARTEAYEVAAYTALVRMARGFGEREVVKLLDHNLKEDKAALREVEKHATRINNETATALAAA